MVDKGLKIESDQVPRPVTFIVVRPAPVASQPHSHAERQAAPCVPQGRELRVGDDQTGQCPTAGKTVLVVYRGSGSSKAILQPSHFTNEETGPEKESDLPSAIQLAK